MLGRALRGHWLDATAFSRARHAQTRNINERPVRRADFIQTYGVTLAPLPAWTALDPVERRNRMAGVVRDICVQARE